MQLVHARRRVVAGLAVMAAVVVLAGCGGTADANSPSGVVRTALDRVAAKDLDGLRPLACEGQEDAIRGELGLPLGEDGNLLPGVSTESLLDAIDLDVSEVDIGEEQVTGDEATVTLSGDLAVTFDAETLRPLLVQALQAQGTPIAEDQLDALLGSLETFGQAVPVNEQIRLVREGGAWKICQAP